MNYARIINNVAIEVFTPPAGLALSDCFHEDVAALFTACPENVTPGSMLDGQGKWTIGDQSSADQPTVEKPESLKVSPVQFKLLFDVQERVAIKESQDPIVKDFFEIVNDPRLTFVDLGLKSTQQALTYLESKKLIGAGRPAQILTGIIQ